jgi:Trp operon repressor
MLFSMRTIKSLSGFRSRKEWEEHIWEILTQELAQADAAEKIGQILKLLITESEKKLIINRAVAISMIQQGKSYREIGRLLWLSPTTISALNKSIRQEGRYITSYSRRKNKEEKRKPLTKKEWRRLKIKMWLSALFTLPSPPSITPRAYKKSLE